MTTLYILFNGAVFVIGLIMIQKNYSNGWMTPPVLSGIAFVLISLPSIIALVF